MPTRPFLIFWSHRQALVTIVKNEIRQRFAGSILGVAWVIIYPLLFLSIYAGIYLFIFKIKVPELSNWGYVLTVFCGLIPYISLSDSLLQGSRALIGNANLLKNTVFPPELIPAKIVLASQVMHASSLLVLVFFTAVSGYSMSRLWLVPCVFLLQLLMVLGLAWMFSAITVAVKDTPYILNLLMLLVLFVSPVAFLPSMVPSRWFFLLHLNPLYYLISLYRAGFSVVPEINYQDLFILSLLSVTIFIAGFTFFRRLKTVFLEYV